MRLLAIRLPCETTTPLGVRVEPEVYCTNAGRSESHCSFGANVVALRSPSTVNIRVERPAADKRTTEEASIKSAAGRESARIDAILSMLLSVSGNGTGMATAPT